MSPRTDEQYEALREESRVRIMEAALKLFALRGYEQTTIRMIAEEAGVAQGLLYNYFTGKQDLLRAIFEQSMHDVRESFTQAGDDPDPRVRLERFIRGSFAIIQSNLRFWKLSYQVRMQPAVLAGIETQLGSWLLDIRQELRRLLAALGKPNPLIEAELLFALIDGVAQHYALEPDTYPLDDVVDALVAGYV